jgi:hypothetical protein
MTCLGDEVNRFTEACSVSSSAYLSFMGTRRTFAAR